MTTFMQLDKVLTLLQQNAVKAGLIVGGLMIAIHAIAIMLSTDQSPTARATRWEGISRTILCAIIIAAVGALITFATAIGGLL